MSHRTNTDQFTYLPGRYFACALRVRHALTFGHKWVAEILSLSGVNRPSGPLLYGASPVGTCVEIKFYAIDATPARWRTPDTRVDFHTGRDAERLEEGLPGELQTRRLRIAVGDKKAECRIFVARPQKYTSGGRSAHAGRVLHRAEEIQGVRAAAAWSPCSLTSMLTLKSTETKLTRWKVRRP